MDLRFIESDGKGFVTLENGLKDIIGELTGGTKRGQKEM